MGQTSAPAGPPNSACWEQVKRVVHFLAIAGILAAIVAFVLPIIWTGISQPNDRIVVQLMDQEAQAAKAHDLTLVATIYTPGAVVTDAGCQSGNQSPSWAGIAQIQNRYLSLPSFIALDHTGAQVTWDPPYSWATKATATANTVGVMLATGGSGKTVTVAGHESWTFVKINDQWFIDRFTYNLC